MFRKLLRFRLSGLLIMTAFVASLAGWYAAAAKTRKQEIATLEALDKSLRGYIHHSYAEGDGPWCGTGLGGYATFSWEGPPGAAKEFLVGKEVDSFFRLKELQLYEWCTPIDDQSIQHLIKFKSLKRLEIPGNHITQKGLDQLSEGLPGVSILVHYYSDDEECLGESAPAIASEGTEDLFGSPEKVVTEGSEDDENPFGGEVEGNPFDF